jgi:hydrogenase nickel incorporation protein HypB
MCTTCGCGPEDQHHHDHDHGEKHDHGHTHAHRHEHKPEHQHKHEHHDGTVAKTISVETDILAKNNRLAEGNRELFTEKGVFVLNLVSSPGSGKTTILEKTLRDLQGKLNFAVIEGDQQTDNDAVRIAATGAPVKQVNTGAGCHLDAHMVCHAADNFDMDSLDVLMIENVGNLVCPASFDLGENYKVVVLSVTEGEDKPLKYPNMFHNAQVMLLNKIDLLPYVDFDADKCKAFARRINPGITIFDVSSKTGEGMDSWYNWIAAGAGKKV